MPSNHGNHLVRLACYRPRGFEAVDCRVRLVHKLLAARGVVHSTIQADLHRHCPLFARLRCNARHHRRGFQARASTRNNKPPESAGQTLLGDEPGAPNTHNRASSHQANTRENARYRRHGVVLVLEHVPVHCSLRPITQHEIHQSRSIAARCGAHHCSTHNSSQSPQIHPKLALHALSSRLNACYRHQCAALIRTFARMEAQSRTASPVLIQRSTLCYQSSVTYAHTYCPGTTRWSIAHHSGRR